MQKPHLRSFGWPCMHACGDALYARSRAMPVLDRGAMHSLGPHRRGRRKGPWATRRAISGPGARCFGCGMGPCSTQTHHSQFWRCRKPGQLPETRADRVRVGLLGLGGAYGPAIPPMLASVLEVKTIVDLTPPCLRCVQFDCVRPALKHLWPSPKPPPPIPLTHAPPGQFPCTATLP